MYKIIGITILLLFFIHEINAQYIELELRGIQTSVPVIDNTNDKSEGATEERFAIVYYYRVIGEKKGFKQVSNGKDLIPYLKTNEEAYKYLKKFRRSLLKPLYAVGVLGLIAATYPLYTPAVDYESAGFFGPTALVVYGIGLKIISKKRKTHLEKAIDLYNEDYIMEYLSYKAKLENNDEFANVDLLMYKSMAVDSVNNILTINAIAPLNEKIKCSLSRKGKKTVRKTVSFSREVFFKFDLNYLKPGRYLLNLKSKKFTKNKRIIIK